MQRGRETRMNEGGRGRRYAQRRRSTCGLGEFVKFRRMSEIDARESPASRASEMCFVMSVS